MRRQIHLVAYLKTGPTALHVGAWRHPGATLGDILDPGRYEHIARVLEAARFDACFFADLFGLYDVHRGSYATYVERGGQISFLDPMVVLPIMARATRHLGLGATLSTTFHTAYHLARSLLSLDVVSGGRCAWNVVTSATELEARNAGLAELPPREERYDRADEVLEACHALWRSWDADAFVLDKRAGRLADPARVHYAGYEGRWVRSRGPLSIPRSAQDHPVIMQAGSSGRGRDFAARWAEVVFTIQRRAEDMRAFYRDLKARVAAGGRDPGACVVLPAVSVVLGETRDLARERAAYLTGLIDPELGRAAWSSSLGADVSKATSVAEVAAAQGNQGMQGTSDFLAQTMRDRGQDLAAVIGEGERGDAIVGTAGDVADQLEALFTGEAADGFVVTPNVFPGNLEEFCRAVVPELQRRGLLRREYGGRTLRENLLG